MAEHIDREKIIARIKRYAAEVYGVDLDSTEQFSEDVFADIFCNGLWSAIELIEDAPAADVAPIVHGRWITKKAATGKEYTICSACDCAVYYTMAGGLAPLDIRNAKYCPNCGAKMQGAGNK